MVAIPRSLADAKRQAGMDHVLAAARKFVMANGLEATMDEIAEASGVSRRTLFRLFGSRDHLIASAFVAGMDFYGHELPAYGGDINAWLGQTCDSAHRMNAASGPGFWELTSRTNLPPELEATERMRRRRFRLTVNDVALVLWTNSGGRGDPPGELVAVIGAHLSPHFTAAVVTDLGQGWEVASRLAYDAIAALLQTLTA
jgi:AcrR family transcriptional regulator